MSKGNSTTNAILVILVIVIVALGIWYITTNDGIDTTDNDTDTSLDINLDGINPIDNDDDDSSGTNTP